MNGSERALEIAARLVTAKAEPDEVVETVLDAALESTKATRAFVALIDRRNGELVIHRIAGKGWTSEKQETRLRAGDGAHEGIVGYVATTGELYHTGDVLRDAHYYPLFDDVRSELAVPLIRSQNRVRGVLNLESPEADAFTPEDERVAAALAALASVAVSFGEHLRRQRELTAAVQRLNRPGMLPEQLESLTETAASIVQATDSSLFLLQQDRRTLVLAASHGRLRERIGHASYQLGEGLTGWVAQHGEAIRLQEVAGDPRWLGKHEEMALEAMAGFLAVPVTDEGGAVEGVLRVIRDKTPRSLPNAFDEDDETILLALSSQVAALLQRDRLVRRVVQGERLSAWGELSARAAHIIGNRVFAMRGAVNELRHLLETGPGCVDDCLELLTTLSRNLSETDRIVQSFKDFVASREGQRESVDANRLLQALLKSIGTAAGKVKLTANLAPALPKLRADPARLTEVFEEIIENAVVWQPEGGAVRVSTSLIAADEAAALTGLKGGGSFVRIDIEDDGPGVAPELKEKIFEPFFSSRGRGLGLGLAICREVVRAQGGEIVEIGEGGGAHFVTVLPAGEGQEGAAQDV